MIERAATDWPAVLTPTLLAQYLGVRSPATLRRRVDALKKHGLADKDAALGGWLRTEIDKALARKRGIVPESDEIEGMLDKWRPQ